MNKIIEIHENDLKRLLTEAGKTAAEIALKKLSLRGERTKPTTKQRINKYKSKL